MEIRRRNMQSEGKLWHSHHLAWVSGQKDGDEAGLGHNSKLHKEDAAQTESFAVHHVLVHLTGTMSTEIESRHAIWASPL